MLLPNYPLTSATLSRWQRSRSFRPPRQRRSWGSPKQLCAHVYSARATFSGGSWQRFWRDIMPEKHDRERHAQADYLLDRVLARYAGEPLAGLENRTLRRLRAQQAAAAQGFLSWRSVVPYIAAAAAAGATVSVSLAIGIHIGQHRANVAWQQRIANSSTSNAVGRAGAVNVPPTSAVTAANTGSRIRRAHTGAAAVEPS